MPEPSSFAIRRFQCRHIFTDGHRCGSPCLRGEDFCYYHHATRRPARRQVLPHNPYHEPPNQTTLTLPLLEDHSSVQLAISSIMQQLASNALDPRRAGLLLYALQIASGNLASTPRHRPDDIVQDVTLDPQAGPLAPANELPGDALHREIMQSLTEDSEDEDYEDAQDEKDLDAIEKGRSIAGHLGASATPTLEVPN